MGRKPCASSSFTPCFYFFPAEVSLQRRAGRSHLEKPGTAGFPLPPAASLVVRRLLSSRRRWLTWKADFQPGLSPLPPAAAPVFWKLLPRLLRAGLLFCCPPGWKDAAFRRQGNVGLLTRPGRPGALLLHQDAAQAWNLNSAGRRLAFLLFSGVPPSRSFSPRGTRSSLSRPAQSSGSSRRPTGRAETRFFATLVQEGVLLPRC